MHEYIDILIASLNKKDQQNMGLKFKNSHYHVIEIETTLWTRMVPAKPLLPAMPLGGGRAQSSPTITIC